MTRVRFLPEAAEELHAAARFYEQLQSGLGQALLQEARLAGERIAERQKASRIERGDIRVRSIPRFPYRIYYRVRAGETVVIAVGHRRRKPGFWRYRT